MGKAPSHPWLLAALLDAVAAESRLPEGALRHADLRETASAASVTLWDDRQWDAALCAPADAAGSVLCTVLRRKGGGAAAPPAPAGPDLRLLNAHLPLEPAGGGDAPEAALRAQLAAAPAGQLALLVGDLNLDVLRAGALLAAPVAAVAAAGGSAIYDGAAVTSDGAVLAVGAAAAEGLEGAPRAGDLTEEARGSPLGGASRADFVKQSINYSLQARVAELGEGLAAQDLGYLGALHFGDQADCLAGWLASGRAKGAAPPPSQASRGRSTSMAKDSRRRSASVK